MGLKEFYLKMEDKYYGVLDNLNSKLPIYKITDPIDRVIPSFALLLAVIAIIIILGVIAVIPLPAAGQTYSLTLSVVDDSGNPLNNADVVLSYEGYEFIETTDLDGLVAFVVPASTTLNVSVEKQGFELTENEYILTQDDSLEIILFEEQGNTLSKTITLTNPRGQPVSNAQLSFSCSSAFATPPSDRSTGYSGDVTVTVPSDCGLLSFSANAPGYQQLQGVSVTQDQYNATMSEDPTQTGTINVNVTYQNNPVDGIEVKLYDAINTTYGYLEVAYSNNGLVRFENVRAGTYYVTTESSSQYSSEQSNNISLSANQTKSVEVSLERSIIGDIEVEVLDESNRVPVENAYVKLLRNNSQAADGYTDSSGEIAFSVSDSTGFEVIVDDNNYLVERANVSIGSNEVLLERFTGANGGTLKVRAIDSTGSKVSNARIALFDNDNGRLADYSEQMTDLNGEAMFERVVNGNYKAFAFKGSSSGESSPVSFDMRTAGESVLTVQMEIPLGTIQVKVVDDELKAVPFARIYVYDEFNNALLASDFTDSNGLYALDMLADKKVYVRAEEGNSRYYTPAKQVIGNTVQKFNVQLEKRLAPGPIAVEFVGLYQAGQLATNVTPGQEYTAKLKVKIPEDNDYDEVGLHLRTGLMDIMEKDKLYVKQVNIPFTTKVKGTSFSLDNGYNVDSQSISFNESKWVNAQYNNPLPGIYEVEALLKITELASFEDKLSLFYRVYGIENGVKERDPVDLTLDTDPLYDSVKEEVFNVGITTLCSEEFCFDAQIFDKEARLLESVTKDYQGDVFKEYNLKMNLINNSEGRIHNNAFLRIFNREENLLFKDYTFTDGGTISGQLNGYEFADYSLGNFNPKQRFSADIDFTTEEAGTGIVTLQVISDFQLVFERNIVVNTTSTKNLLVELNPSELPSGVENLLKVKVKDASSNLEVENAAIKVVDRFGIPIASVTTNRLGYAELDLPAQNPGENLKVIVESPEYNTKEIALKVKADILDLTPNKLGIALNVKNKFADDQFIKARNVTNFPFKVDSMELTGNFKGLLDEEEMNNFIDQYEGLVFYPNEERELTFRSILSKEAATLQERELLEGRLRIRATNFGQLWNFDIPLKIDVGLGSEVDEPDCLTLTNAVWNTSSEGQPIRTEFEILNNCVVNGNPVLLRDLSAKLDLKGNLMGEYNLEILKEGEPVAKSNIRGNYFKQLVGAMQPESRYHAVLTYTPYGGVIGEQKADLLLKAVNPLDTGDQELTVPLQTNISIVNIQECIDFSKEYLDIKSKEGKTKFTIETKECGGNTDFKLESKLRLSDTEFTLGPAEKREIEVTVLKEMYPGQYPITVELKPNHSQTFREEEKTIKVLYEPPGCLRLNRYEFDVFDDPNNPYDGYDYAELINDCYNQRVTVRLGQKSLVDALVDGGLIWGGAALGLSGISTIARGALEEDYSWGTGPQELSKDQKIVAKNKNKIDELNKKLKKGEINEEDYKKEMKKIGVSDEFIDKEYKKITESKDGPKPDEEVGEEEEVECEKDEDCKGDYHEDCADWSCINGSCAFFYKTEGTSCNLGNAGTGRCNPVGSCIKEEEEATEEEGGELADGSAPPTTTGLEEDECFSDDDCGEYGVCEGAITFMGANLIPGKCIYPE